MYRRPTGSAKVNAPFKPLQISRPVEASDVPVPKIRALVPQKRGLLSVKVEENKRPVSGEGSRYNVLWRKVKNKKNKTWDGDGILSVENGYATVKNSANGKPVVSNSRFTSPIEIGDIIKMGYIEIQAEYVYTEVTKPPSDSKLIDGGKLSGHFQTPSLSKPLSKSKLGPRHDPKSAGAIVMPRPLEPIGRKVIDVVIDPLLGSKLRPHQIEGIKFLYQCIMGMKHYQGRGALLADDMGLGKTLMAITLIWTLLKQCPFDDEPFLVKRVLVVCPVTLIGNWKNEFRKWLGKDRIGIFVVDSKTANIRDFVAGRIYQVMIIGYEKIRSVANELKLANFDLVICDEGHRLKTATNKSAQAILSLNTKRRIILSGTPIQNDLSEFYSMVDFLNPEILGTYAQFKKLFEIPIMKSRQPTAMKRDIEKGNAQSEELSRITEQFILRRSVKTLENYLPPKTETVLFCLPTAKQREVYVSLLNSKEIKDCFQNDSAQDHLLAITLLKKVCNSPALVDTDLTC
jgi:DNA repair and recombination protein RAD54B